MNKYIKQIVCAMLAITMVFGITPIGAMPVLAANDSAATANVGPAFNLNNQVISILAPKAPEVAAVSISYNSIKLSWPAVNWATGYVVYRYNPATKAYELATMTTSVNFTDTALNTGTTYKYKVESYRTRILNGKNIFGLPSDTISVKPVLAAPSFVTATKVSRDSVKLTWQTVEGATGYLVYRSKSIDGNFIRIQKTASTSFLNKCLANNKNYFYKVKAYRKNKLAMFYSDYSTAVEINNKNQVFIKWNEALNYVGKEVTLTGKVVKTVYESGSNKKLTFLDIGYKCLKNNRVSIVIMNENRYKFSQSPEILYANKTVSVTGAVVLYNGAAEIEINDPSKIIIM